MGKMECFTVLSTKFLDTGWRKLYTRATFKLSHKKPRTCRLWAST